MSKFPTPLDLKTLKVYPLAQRRSLSRIEDILIHPDAEPPGCPESVRSVIAQCGQQILDARQRKASVIFMYGAHLVKNGGASIIERLISGGWITHLATNG